MINDAYILHELYAGYHNTCIVQGYAGHSKKYSILCFGSDEHNLTLVPLPFINNPDEGMYVSIGLYNICGIIYDPQEEEDQRTIICWGNNLNGVNDIPSEILQPFMVAVGDTHACSINSHLYENYGSVGCWGFNTSGQLEVPGLFEMFSFQVAVGHEVSCGLLVNWYLQCWGEVGTGIPDYVRGYTRLISAGGRHSCKYNNKLNCYGNNDFGQLDVPKAQEVSTIHVSSGWDYSCAVNLSMQVSCWGLNILGQTDLPQKIVTSSPGYTNNPQILDISTGLNHSCAIYRKNNYDMRKLTCWGGYSEFGELDIPHLLSYETSLVAVGDYHTCACAITHTSYSTHAHRKIGCWGDNEFGQTSVPGSVEEYGLKQMVAGSAHTCARIGSNLVCWGSDSQGQLSIDFKARTSAYTVATGTAHTCVIYIQNNLAQDGGDSVGKTEVRCYGKWVTPKVERESRLLVTGYEHSCLVDLDGKAYCWGENEYGQLMKSEEG